jgi:hypothetical protein
MNIEYGTFVLNLFKALPTPISIGGGRNMSEIPVPLVNYVQLIRSRKSPYYDIVQFLLRDLEMHFARAGEGTETVYAINPRILQEEIEKRVNSDKITTVNVCRTVLAMLYGSKLSEDEDFYITTTSSGRRNYHIKVNDHTMRSMNRML